MRISSQFGQAKAPERFNAHGLILHDIPDFYSVPVSVEVDFETDVLKEVCSSIECDFPAFENLFDRLSETSKKLQKSGVYNPWSSLLKTDIDYELFHHAGAFSQVMNEFSLGDDGKIRSLRDDLYANQKQVLLSDLFSQGLCMCAENSILMHRWLKTQGAGSWYIGASVYNPAKQSGSYHAFLAVSGGADNRALFLDPGTGLFLESQSVYLPHFYVAPLKETHAFLEQGRQGKSWLETQSVWKIPQMPQSRYFGFDSLTTTETVQANLAAPAP